MQTILLNICLGIGALCVFIMFMTALLPEEQKEGITDVETRVSKDTSAFASLDPEKSLWDRMCLYIATALKLEPKLDDLYMLSGSQEIYKPVLLLKQKMLYAVLLPWPVLYLFGPVMALISVPVGFIIPDSLLKSKIQKRQKDLLAGFSTTVDLAALIIESGLDYMTAFERIVRVSKNKTILEAELEKMLNEVKLGYSRREALERLSRRTGIQEIRSFTGLIIQSDELGTSLVELLRNFSVDLRFRRMNKAEKMAAQASTKMLIPLFVFIFPTVLILMLVPMLMDLMGSGGLGF